MTCLLMLNEEGISASDCYGQVNKILFFLLLLVWNAGVLHGLLLRCLWLDVNSYVRVLQLHLCSLELTGKNPVFSL